MSATQTAFDQIRENAAKAFFACAWADMVEENGRSLCGEIMDQIPDEIDPAAYHAADTLLRDFAGQYQFDTPDMTLVQQVACLYMRVVNLCLADSTGQDRELDPEMFGHYLAMQAMGTGVGIESFGHNVRDNIKVPYVEFGAHSLEKDYE